MRREAKKRRNIIIALTLVLCLMTAGYAAYQTQLNIGSTTNINTKWDIEITNVEIAKDENNKDKITGKAETVTATYDNTNGLTATMEANLYKKGDSVEYEVTIKNKGDLDARLNSIEYDNSKVNDAVKITFSNYIKGERLAVNESKIIKVKIEYNPEFSGTANETISSEVKATFNYTQGAGSVEEGTAPTTYLLTYDCTTNGTKTCENYNEYLNPGDSIDLTKTAPTIKDYTFLGWNTNKDAKTALTEIDNISENTTLYAIYKGYPIMKSWASNATTDFHANKTTITNVEIVDLSNPTLTVPEINDTTSWDVSEKNDGTVIAWLDGTNLYIGGEGGVIANPDSSYLFSGFTGMLTANLAKLNTSRVTDMNHMFYNCQNITSLDLSKFDTSNVTNMSSMFSSGSDRRTMKLQTLNISNFNTSNVTDMNSMFRSCRRLVSLDLNSFDTSNVTDMSYMFRYCTDMLSLDLTNFNTSKVTDMNNMFYWCYTLTELDLSNFDVSNVTDMNNMIGYCSSLEEVNVSNFDAKNVTNMYRMFYHNGSLTNVNMSNFSISKVTNMQEMFNDCTNLTSLDLSNFDTSNVTNMKMMFNACTSLKTIYVSDKFVTSKVTDSANMFYYCTNLVGGNGTIYDENNIDKTYAVIDTASTPGYFTDGFTPTLSTTRSSDSIIVVANVGSPSQITKYEFSNDGGETMVDNGTSNVHEFTDLVKDETYDIEARTTDKSGNTHTSDNVTIVNSDVLIPTFNKNENVVTIIYPSGCGSTYTCKYVKDEEDEVTVTTTTQNVTFTKEGVLVAKVIEGNNETVSSYTVSMPLSMQTLTKLNQSVVTEDDGLYADSTESGRYVFRGTNPNNYITIAGEEYRILAIEPDGAIKVIRNDSIGSMPWDPGYSTSISGITESNNITGTRYSNNSGNYCYISSASYYNGCKVWSKQLDDKTIDEGVMLDKSGTPVSQMPWEVNSTSLKDLPTTDAYINNYLNNTYLNSLIAKLDDIDSSLKNKIITHIFNVGPVKDSSGQTLETDIEQEKAYTWKGKVGLMTATDYIKANTNIEACGTVYVSSKQANTATCKETNWLMKSWLQWTMSPESRSNAASVWSVTNSFQLRTNSPYYNGGIRPVLFISSDITLTGTGEQGSNAYQIVS